MVSGQFSTSASEGGAHPADVQLMTHAAAPSKYRARGLKKLKEIPRYPRCVETCK